MANKGGIIGAIITVVIGGTVFTVSQADIVNNFSKDTGLSQEQAKQYVENIKEDDLIPYDEVGADFISDGQDLLNAASKIDCVNYSYEWEIESLSCGAGKSQIARLGSSEIELGKAYTTLASDSASTADISTVIRLIDKLNADLDLPVVRKILDFSTIDEVKKTNSFNKAMLQAALDSK